jgi:hypothetical protein
MITKQNINKQKQNKNVPEGRTFAKYAITSSSFRIMREIDFPGIGRREINTTDFVLFTDGEVELPYAA